MAEPVNIAEQSYRQFRTEFESTSLGTEEELAGTTIKTALAAPQMIGYVAKDAEALVQITKDLQVGTADGHGVYTIELRTTPTELDDVDGWGRRRRARQIAIWAIEESRGGKPLAESSWRSYDTVIGNTAHQIMAVPSDGVAGADRQSTVGVPAADIGATATTQERALGKLHPYLTLPWYKEKFTGDEAVAKLPDQARIAYALVISAIWQLAMIWDKHPNGLNLLAAKNLWVVRPRTPPIKILDTLDDGPMSAAIEAILKKKMPGQTSIEQWEKARVHIKEASPMGGHALPDATVDGDPTMLFEYRTAPELDYPYAFWQPGELTVGDFPEDG